MTADFTTRDFDLVLVLSGGNALGAFEAGVYAALHDHGLFPDWIVGASIGAINGALIAGSTLERRVERLRSFWCPDRLGDAAWLPVMETARRTVAASWTVAAGRPGIFGPLLSAQGWAWGDQRSIFDTGQLVATLARDVDFDTLNAGRCRFTATAVDLATGADVAFDTARQRVEAHHIRASAALPVLFPPVKIDSRWFVDAGVSANLPLDPVIADPPQRPALCLAVDLLPLGQPLPGTIGEMAGRMQDLMFAAQSRRTIARWQAATAGGGGPGIALVRLAYEEQGAEVAGKALDFSGPTVARRWSAGQRAATQVVAGLARGTVAVPPAGLDVVDPAAYR